MIHRYSAMGRGLVHSLLSRTNERTPSFLFQVSYMISAWARMCKIMGKDFEQYLPLVMGPVLKAASLKPDVMIVDGKRSCWSSCPMLRSLLVAHLSLR